MRQLPPLSATRTTVSKYISARPSPCIIIQSRERKHSLCYGPTPVKDRRPCIIMRCCERKDSLCYIPATPVKDRRVCIIMQSWERERNLCYVPTPAVLKAALYT